MIDKPNQHMRMYGYMVLATISVLLALFSTSPMATNSKTIVGASSASQHARSVGPRAKRFLISSSNVTKNIDQDGEERVPFVDFFSEVTKKELTEAASSFRKIKVAPDYPTGTGVNFQKWILDAKESYPHFLLKADEANIVNILSRYNEEDILKVIAADKKVPDKKADIENLEFALVLKRMADGRHEDALLLLIAEKGFHEFLKSPFLSAWMKQYWNLTKENPLKYLFGFIEPLYNEATLATRLVTAKQNVDTAKMAAALENLQYESWLGKKFDCKAMFNALGLNNPNMNVFQNPLWKTWIVYTTKLDLIRKPARRSGDPTLIFLTMWNSCDYKTLVNWIAKGKAFEGTKKAAEKFESEMVDFITKNRPAKRRKMTPPGGT